MTDNVRGDIIARRTYCRPLDADYEKRESWDDVIQRVMSHSLRLWADAGGVPVRQEIESLGGMLKGRKHGMVAGRTLWLGGTELAYRRPACQFNCAFSNINSVPDFRDCFWLLLNGAGVGFNPANEGRSAIRGLNPGIGLDIIRSTRDKTYRGREDTQIAVLEATLTISVGDSAEGWVRALQGILNAPLTDEDFTSITLDFSECRGAGQALKGYGWMCTGSDPFATALERIVGIMKGYLKSVSDDFVLRYTPTGRGPLNPIQITDMKNSLGEILSTRRSAQIACLDFSNPFIEEFVDMKSRENLARFPWRMQSNNSVMFEDDDMTPENVNWIKEQVREHAIEPGIINASAARRRAPWFAGLNPCAEILLADGGFCNLVEVNLSAFVDEDGTLNLRDAETAVYLLARHNYRQTCVNLKDGILQDKWHNNNERLRLCGVSLTGFGEHEPTEFELRVLKRMADFGAYSMAVELGTTLPANITTVKPSGTVSKVMGTSEGVHTPIGRYIFNWVCFSSIDPLLPSLREANYTIIDHPTIPETVLVCLPQEFKSDKLQKSEHGFEYDDEPVEAQFKRYMKVQHNWCDQNVSNTIYYRPTELDTLFDLIFDNWDDYVAFSFQPRQDLSKTKEEILAECNSPYLPQELVTQEVFENYVNQLQTFDVFGVDDGDFDLLDEEGCANGACPVR